MRATRPRILIRTAIALGLGLAVLGPAASSPASAAGAGYTAYAYFNTDGTWNNVLDVYVKQQGASYEVTLKDFSTDCTGTTTADANPLSTAATRMKVDPLLASATLTAASLTCTRPGGIQQTYSHVTVTWKASKPMEFVPVGLYRSAATTWTGAATQLSGLGWMGIGLTG